MLESTAWSHRLHPLSPVCRSVLAGVLAGTALALPAQTAPAMPGQCILAGRLSADQWAPRMAAVELLDANGQRVAGPPRQALPKVRQVRLNQTALLASCDGDQPLAQADNAPMQPKSDVPALTAGKDLLAVASVAYPKLRTGGELVEIRLADVPAQRVILLRR
jgi:hypothetical protein